MKKHNYITGFTLIELAIVVVIIGLLTAAVRGGYTLLEGSKTNSIISDLKKYKSAYDSFVLQYSAIPGDMIDAVTPGAGAPPALKPFAGADYTPYNGDGDSVIRATGGGLGEHFNTWNHLAMAQLIKGKYATNIGGATVATLSSLLIGRNFPGGAHGGSGYFLGNPNVVFNTNTAAVWPLIRPFNAPSATTDFITTTANLIATYDNSLLYSNSIYYISFNSLHATTGILSGNDVAAIDQKIDDGLYMRGGLSGATALGAASTCNTAANSTAYRINQPTQLNCVLIYNVEKKALPQ
jgi:prepilin-type N-terminal cleavage/methylation domain-containing protein